MVVSPLNHNNHISKIWPSPFEISEELPQRAREFLSQAVASLHAPAGAVMLTASSVDAMLKAKGLKDGSLNSRIEAAAKEHLNYARNGGLGTRGPLGCKRSKAC